MKQLARRSPLALAILSLLVEEPMHPYRMQQLIKERDKGDVINVRLRASLYQTIERLLRDGLIVVRETTRAENRPERTVYSLTETGRETARAWLRAMLATPVKEFPEFPAAIAHLPLLPPDEVRAHLEQRVAALEAEIALIETRLEEGGQFLPRLFLLESEYLLEVRRAEVTWVRLLVDDLRTGQVTWSEEWLQDVAERVAASPAMTERRQT